MKPIDPPNTLAAGYASLLSPNLTCRAIAAWALLGLSAAQAATSFTFTLPIPARTSAGVYRPDGTLLRTLWNEEPFRAGSHTATWDDKDDAGNALGAGCRGLRPVSRSCREYLNVSRHAVP